VEVFLELEGAYDVKLSDASESPPSGPHVSDVVIAAPTCLAYGQGFELCRSGGVVLDS
jgi:hypothetical protein